jgi:hypothetical protein
MCMSILSLITMSFVTCKCYNIFMLEYSLCIIQQYRPIEARWAIDIEHISPFLSKKSIRVPIQNSSSWQNHFQIPCRSLTCYAGLPRGGCF